MPKTRYIKKRCTKRRRRQYTKKSIRRMKGGDASSRALGGNDHMAKKGFSFKPDLTSIDSTYWKDKIEEQEMSDNHKLISEVEWIIMRLEDIASEHKKKIDKKGQDPSGKARDA